MEVVKKLILLVEDDDVLRQLLTDFILYDGVYGVVALSSGVAAYQWLAENQAPDIVLTDFHMPNGRGDLLARSLYRMNIPVIMISGNPEEAASAIRAMDFKIPVASKNMSTNNIMSLIDKMTATNIKKETA